MEDFCGSVFWDSQLTWNTTDPYLTPCFEDTTVTWFPAIFIILFALVDIKNGLTKRKFGVSSSSGNVAGTVALPWNVMSIMKVVVTVALIAASATQLALIHSNEEADDPVQQSDTFAPVAKIISYVIALVLLVFTKYSGIRSSGVQSLFWFSAAVAEAVLFRTAIEKYDSTSSKADTVYLFRLITFPLVFYQFVLQFWADSTPDVKNRDKLFGKPCPEKTSSFFSKILYTWYDSMAWKGYRNPLTNADLWDLNEADASKTQVPLFTKYWNAEQAKAKAKGKEAGILWVLFRAYWPTFFMGGLLKLATDLLAFVSPEILKLLVEFVANPFVQTWKGYLYAGVLLATALLQAILNAQYNRRMLLIGMRVRTALSNAVYRKALFLSNAVKKDASVGEIVNLMSVDTQRFMDLMPFIHLIWCAPIQIALSIYFLYNILGAAVFAGLGVMLLMIPINGVIAAKIRELQMKQMALKDDRVKLMSEILSGIKVLKLYAWEPSFEDQIKEIRAKEVVLLRKAMLLNTSTIFAFTCAPFLVALATFSTFVYTDEFNILNSERAFVSLSLLNIMRMPLTMFPMVIAILVQTMVSVARLNGYLNSEEIDPNAVSHDPKEKDPVVIENGSFSWNEESVTLKDINLRVKAGSLVAVVGTVGSGKSTLLNAILGDLKKVKGRVNTTGTQAYVAQGAWIQNASLRDNILFGDPFNHTNYNKVINACSLGPDLEILSAGDETEIGEKGINLSGGQKQRVALARAAYKDSDVYFFDDPLSAVDAHVGKHIFESLIGPTGLLKGKTRILVTHGVSFLPKTDVIVVMKDGMISEMGTYKELLLKKGEFASFLLEHLGAGDSDSIDEAIIQDLEEVVGKDEVKRSSSIDINRLYRRGISKESVDMQNTKRQSQKKQIIQQAAAAADEKTVKTNVKLIEAEKTETGAVKAKVYLEYIKGSGIRNFAIAMGFNILFQALSSYSNIWLSDWSDEAQREQNLTGTQNYDTTDKYLGVYGGLGGAQAIAVLIGAIGLGLGSLRAGAKLHENMLSRIMRAPMWFFDTTPLGRLVNRFAKDVDTADNIIPLNLRASLNIILSVLATVVVISYSTVEFLAFIVPTGILYFFLQRFYVATSRQLKRLESVSRSPIYSQFGETISGATTIRAFALQDDFIESSEKKIDYNQKTYFPYIASNLWIAVRLEAIGGLIIFASALFAILGRKSISPGIIGLSVSYALQITQLLSFLVRTLSDLESNIVAIERMKETTESPQEADWNRTPKPPKEWPPAGKLEFKGYQTRYREGLDLVLRGITCSIEPGEKIGIVGRTGAGKSSMTLALFRLVEPAGGSILIDGVDVTSLGLHDLRSKITIIPQDPVLFSGTLRGNLDPFNLHSDDQVWSCLELAHLKTFVKSLPEGLGHAVAEEGQNYSVGQRQLVCLARALLRKTKILVLDEATAAVDLETDDLIQKTIRSEFKHSTVVTIAHRLNTIMDSTRVLVLDKGEIREFDTPEALLKNTESIFYGMAKDAGIV